jgi:V8-like Glu-specific endopeptidase
MSNAKASKAVFFLCAAMAVGSLVPALAHAAGQGKPLLLNSYDDKEWKGLQAVARPWTREEMMSAVPADMPRVNEDTLQMWAAEAMSKSVYDTQGGPGFEPGAAPGGRVAKTVEPVTAGEAMQSGMDKGYSYPAPFTRYETFPNYTGFPHTTVGKVFFTKPGVGNFVCSASSIGGDGVITAAHCVHDGATNTFWSNWVFVPAYKNGAAPYGQWTANHLWVGGGYINGGSGDSRYDVGGAVLNRIGGLKISQKVGYLGFAWNQTNTSGTGAHWAIIGYPQAAPFNGGQQFICQTSYGYSAGGSAPSPIGVGCDQTGGTSGGPWIRNYSGTGGASNYANGVNSYRRCFDNACTSLYTQELFSPYFDNSTKALKDCIVNSVPGNPANPALNCAPGT